MAQDSEQDVGLGADEDDPAVYLLKTSKYHDCYITVGDPASDEVEKIGVHKTDLIAHSRVFREMVEDSELADPTGVNTHITDVRPAVFKLMLRHVYGGQMPEISREMAVELALCADKYNIQLLLKRACGLLAPKSVDDVFPALICVAYINAADLLPSVRSIVQEQTNILIESDKFWELDENCLEFIAKQETLAVTEIELWKSLVNWAKKKSDDPSEQRKQLRKPLRHLRFMTLTQDDIIKEVMNTGIISPVEVVSILSAITDKQPSQIQGICSTVIKRNMFTTPDFEFKLKHTVGVKMCVKIPSLKNQFGNYVDYRSLELNESSFQSNFTIFPSKNMDLVSFICKSRSYQDTKTPTYSIKVEIRVLTFDALTSHMIATDQLIWCGMILSGKDFTIPIKTSQGGIVNLYPLFSYNFDLRFYSNLKHLTHPQFAAYHLSSNQHEYIKSYGIELKTEGMRIKPNTDFHVSAIEYRENQA